MTVSSMTGFARAQDGESGPSPWAWTWEARSVNGKGLDVRLRLPAGFEGLEVAVREAVAKRFRRGNISLTLSAQRGGDERPSIRVNRDLLRELALVAAEFGRDHPGLVAPARLDGLMAVKGVIEAVGDVEDEAAVRAREGRMLATLERALESLAAARAEEGRRLAGALAGHVDAIARLSIQAAATAAIQPEAIRERLRALVGALLEAQPSLSEDRLAQEAALLVTRADVREELDRLHAHVAAAHQLLAEDGAIGRKLDFLCQEFNREANTLCSKSPSVDLTRIGLDLKATIDQLREQVQNIE